MSTLELFLPLAKVDLDQRIVQGVATAETPDRSGEICDYVSTKPYFETWSADAEAASGGKSLGAVRAMHNRVAAGKLTDIAFDDDNKRILVTAKIVDDDEWEKVKEGVYTGFSQGGRYVQRWPDEETGLTRYTAEPREISLVDLPCLPDATFEVVKDGIVEKRAFAARADSPTRIGESASAPPPAGTETSALTKASSILAKAVHALSLAADRLEKAIGENAALRKAIAELPPAVTALGERVRILEAQPLPARAALHSLAKTNDGFERGATGSEAAIQLLASLPPQERALALTKISLANPQHQRL